MPIINGQPLPNPEVNYQGHTIPPKPPLDPIVPQKTTIVYDGKTLQRIPAGNPSTVADPSNNPALVLIGNVQLSGNVVVPLKDKKLIAKSQIIDGVTVFEHVSREACEIDFDLTIFPIGVITGEAGGQQKTIYNNTSTFNQQALNNFWNTIFIPNTVQPIQNTYLNGLGINQIIIESIAISPRPGTVNIGIKLKAYENQIGTLFVGFQNSNFIDTPVSSSSSGNIFA